MPYRQSRKRPAFLRSALVVLAFSVYAAACADGPTESVVEPAQDVLLLLAENPEALTVLQHEAAKELLATDAGAARFAELLAEPRLEPRTSGGPATSSASKAYTVEPIPFRWEDRPATTTPALDHCDDCNQPAPIGFDFEFFGVSYNTVQITTNGLVGFNAFTSPTYVPRSIPANEGPHLNNIIAVLWTDMNPYARGAVYYGTVGTAPNRRFVVHYNNICYYVCYSNADVQLVLHENGNIIEIHARQAGAKRITQGIENATGTEAYYLPGRNNSYFGLTNDGVRFTPGGVTDSDGDGVPNDEDAFPDDPNESADSDGDGVGDNADAFPDDPNESADSDGDGVGDNADAFPNSDLGPTVSVDGCDAGVANQLLAGGATLNDLIGAASASARNHGQFVSAVSRLADGWKKAGLISGRDQGAITSCAGRSR